MRADKQELEFLRQRVIGCFTDLPEELSIKSGADVFIAIMDPWSAGSNMTLYAPIGQHGPLDSEYLELKARPISKEEYLKAAGPNGTPQDYLDILDGKISAPDVDSLNGDTMLDELYLLTQKEYYLGMLSPQDQARYVLLADTLQDRGVEIDFPIQL